MSLVEIIQLVLVGFIAISLSIFLFSYVGYRSKNKDSTSKMRLDVNNVLKSSNIEEDAIELQEKNKTNLPASKAPITKKSKIKNKFEVFRLSKDNLKKHFPKIIKSDISTETNKKK